jgi:tRNA (guanosine-2'-O-)-methyltransferase
VGAELEGPSPVLLEAADLLIGIPMHGAVESLNVSVAAAVILYEAQRQRQRAGLYDTTRLAAADYARTLFEWCHPEIAERCRRRGVPYPALSADGDLLENPLRDAGP